MSGCNPRRARLLGGVAAASLILSAFAASAAQAQSEPQELDVVIVTAQKRAQDTLDVGLNVAVVGSQELAARRVTQVADIAAFTPNVGIKENMPGILPVVTIRGVGLNDFSVVNNPSAGVYVDEVYLSSLALMNFDLFDLERMEALKGPQGTLYGRNSTAGAINVVTAKPSFAGRESRLAVSYGDYETLDVDGMINVPLSDTLALRLAGKYARQGEGYFLNRSLGRDIGRRDVRMARAQLLWRPTPDVDVLTKIEIQKSRSEVGAPEFFGLTRPPGAPADLVCPGSPGCMDLLGYRDVDGDPFKGEYSVDPSYDFDQRALTTRVNADLGRATLTSVTGYIDFKRQWGADTDAGPFPELDFIARDRVHQLSQELRLAGSTDRTEWQAGVFASRDRVKTAYDGDLRALFNTRLSTFADQTSKSAAIFGNLERKLAPTLSLVTGLRYTWEEKYNNGFDKDLVSECPASFLSMVPCGAGPVTLASIDRGIEDRNWSWKVGLNWKPDPLTLVYALVSQGVKSGGFFSGVATTSAQLQPYRPETLVDYEIGIKQRLPKAGLSWSGSAFYYDYTDVQTFIRDESGGLPIQRLGNVRDATIYGADLDASLSPPGLKGLDLTAGLGILHTELGEFSSSAGLVPKGNQLPDAPKVSFNLAAAYTLRLGDDLRGRAQVDGHRNGKSFKDALNDPLIVAPAYWLWNARASVLSSSDDWEVAVWVKNLADKRYLTQAVNNLPLGVGFRVYGAPRTWGVSVSKAFR
jgi:iron complex outermembrane receptor protein